MGLVCPYPGIWGSTDTHMITRLRCGAAASNTATRLDLGTILSSMECLDSSRSKTWELSLWLCIEGNFCNSVMLPWLKAQLQIPSTQWLQPSGKTDATIPKRTPNIMSADFRMATKILQTGLPQEETTRILTCLRPPPCSLF